MYMDAPPAYIPPLAIRIPQKELSVERVNEECQRHLAPFFDMSKATFVDAFVDDNGNVASTSRASDPQSAGDSGVEDNGDDVDSGTASDNQATSAEASARPYFEHTRTRTQAWPSDTGGTDAVSSTTDSDSVMKQVRICSNESQAILELYRMRPAAAVSRQTTRSVCRTSTTCATGPHSPLVAVLTCSRFAKRRILFSKKIILSILDNVN